MLFEVMLQKFFKAVHPLLQRGEKPADMMPVCRRVMAGYGQGQPQLSFFLIKLSTIREVARFTYSEQLRLLLNGIGTPGDHLFSGVVLTCNIALFLAVFLVLYHRKGLE